MVLFSFESQEIVLSKIAVQNLADFCLEKQTTFSI